jgi:type II secretory pathway predicted ATPase ExeA
MDEIEVYARTWGATAVPFGPMTERHWLSLPSHQRAVSLLNQTVALRGVMLLSGGNGMGKSSLVGRWARQLESRLYTTVLLTQATLSGTGLLSTLVRQVGKRAGFRRERNLDELSTFLLEHERQTLVIVLDDAQDCTHGTLEELRLLLGLNLPTQPTFALVLIGDEYLLGQLQMRNHRALCSRLGAHHTLNPWTLEEVQEYLKKGLEAVGIHRTRVFEPAAVDLLVRASAGVPRSVCLLARAAWLEAARAGVQEIGAPIVQSALDQVPGLAGLARSTP